MYMSHVYVCVYAYIDTWFIFMSAHTSQDLLCTYIYVSDRWHMCLCVWEGGCEEWICVYICVCVSLYMYIHVHMYVYIHIDIRLHIYLYIYTYMYIHMYICMYIYICIYTCRYVYTYIYIYIYTYTFIMKPKRICPCHLLQMKAIAADLD